MRRVASMPSTTGIWMSMSAMSGRCCRASATASPPSAASATTVDVVLVVEEGAEPAADERLVVGQQDPDHDAGSTGSSAWTVKPPSLRGAARRWPPRAVTRSRIPSRPDPGDRRGLRGGLAVVVDADVERAGAVADPDRRGRGGGVPGDVGQRLLDDPVARSGPPRRARRCAVPRSSALRPDRPPGLAAPVPGRRRARAEGSCRRATPPGSRAARVPPHGRRPGSPAARPAPAPLVCRRGGRRPRPAP